MFRLAGGLKLSRRALLEGTILAGVGTTVLQVFSTELLAGAGRNPILAPFAIIIGLLIWFNLVSQVYLVAAAWSAIREEDLKAAPAAEDHRLGVTAGAARKDARGEAPPGRASAPGGRHRPASRY